MLVLDGWLGVQLYCRVVGKELHFGRRDLTGKQSLKFPRRCCKCSFHHLKRSHQRGACVLGDPEKDGTAKQK